MSFFSEKSNQNEIHEKIKIFLNNNQDTLKDNSPRATGDKVQELLSDNWGNLFQDKLKDFNGEHARRAMADLSFSDLLGNYFVVDIKTHNTDTKFNMPNLVSVERLARFYKDPNNTFSLLMVHYSQPFRVSEVVWSPIEGLDWDCLTLGALGWGQIQIANANKIALRSSLNRSDWMIQLCNNVLHFYDNEIVKIGERKSYFEKELEYWKNL